MFHSESADDINEYSALYNYPGIVFQEALRIFHRVISQVSRNRVVDYFRFWCDTAEGQSGICPSWIRDKCFMFSQLLHYGLDAVHMGYNIRYPELQFV